MEEQDWDLETDFDLDVVSGGTLKIENKHLVNREKIVEEDIRNTRFKATLSSVTYGTFESTAACLIIFKFSFFFRVSSRSRFTHAEVQISFGQAKDASFTQIVPYDPLMDPIVKVFAPVEVWGQTKVVHTKKTWGLEVPVVVNIPAGPEVGITLNGGVEKGVDVDHRMNIQGDTLSDDNHVNGDNEVEWLIDENRGQRDGIPHHLTTAIVVLLPPNDTGMQVKVAVQPSVAFSLNPMRLVQRKHDPLFLDRKTPKGKSPLPAGITEFSDESIDWAKVIGFEDEYKVMKVKSINDISGLTIYVRQNIDIDFEYDLEG